MGNATKGGEAAPAVDETATFERDIQPGQVLVRNRSVVHQRLLIQQPPVRAWVDPPAAGPIERHRTGAESSPPRPAPRAGEMEKATRCSALPAVFRDPTGREQAHLRALIDFSVWPLGESSDRIPIVELARAGGPTRSALLPNPWIRAVS